MKLSTSEMLYLYCISWDSSVVWHWATGWMIGGLSPGRGWEFSLHHCVQTGSGAHPASYPAVPEALSLGVKQPGCEADHSPPSSAEVKDVWSCFSTPPVHLHGMVLN
jgi:hypothetical protein